VEDVSVLRQVPLFAELAVSELEMIAAASRRKQYPKRSIVFYEGDRGEYLLVVLDGRVKVSLLGRGGEELLIRTLKRHDFLGEIALFDDAPRSATVIAVERTEVLEIGREPFLEIVAKQPPIALKIMTQLAKEVRRATEQLRTLAMFDVHGRVLRCLLTIALDNGQCNRTRMVIKPRPTVAEIARMVGCERETVSRAMVMLRENGYVTEVDGGVVVEQRAVRQYLQPSLQNLRYSRASSPPSGDRTRAPQAP
jgi:CRP/FNR family transcriptional regulator, cyclic AMP receptor protein